MRFWSFRRPWALILILAAVATGRAEEISAAKVEKSAVLKQVAAGIELLDRVYWSPALSIWLDRPGDDLRAHLEGRRNPPWWSSANAVELLIDVMNLAGTTEYDPQLESMYRLWKDAPARRERVVAELRRRGQWTSADDEELRRRNAKAAPSKDAAPAYYSDFQNEYLDDSGWWALAWLKMYDRTHDSKYLHTATTIHQHMARNWRPEKGGGILWCEDEDKQRPNSITNSLFLVLSARLYERTHEPGYLSWAEKSLEWIHTAGLYDGTGVVDAPGHNGDYWSYNQGVLVGGLTALYLATDQPAYLDEAAKVAESVLARSGLVLPDGVQVEKQGIGGDATLFKGIMARYFDQLDRVLRARSLHSELAATIERMLRANAESLVALPRESGGLFRADWHTEGKSDRADFNTQVSALMALVAFAGS